jgi:hypothetical protein
MPDLSLITRHPLPKRLEGGFSHFSLGPLPKQQLLSIEDRFFECGQRVQLQEDSSAVVLPDVAPDDWAVQRAVTLSEFSLSVLTVSGHVSFTVAAVFSGGTCTKATTLAAGEVATPEFIETISGAGAAQWLRRCSFAQKELNDRLHTTARRFVRFARSGGDADGLLDLCISLESLLDSQTEVSFRFGVSLAKAAGGKGATAREMAELLSQLYDFRSKLVHGDPAASKLLTKLEPKLPALR